MGMTKDEKGGAYYGAHTNCINSRIRDPTHAGVAFIMAKGAVEAGHKPEILLAGDAAVLARKVVAESVLPVGLPPLKELAQFAVEHSVPVYT